MSEIEDFAEQARMVIFNGTVGREFLEKVVLALIRGCDEQANEEHKANPQRSSRPKGEMHPQQQEARLREAMIAIAGKHHSQEINEEKQEEGKKRRNGINDEMLLYYMAARFPGDINQIRVITESSPFRSQSTKPYTNLTDLARDALNHYDAWSTTSENDAQTKRLMKKFSERKEDICKTIIYADEQVHVVEHELLKKLQYLLAIADIKFSLPRKPQAW
tara:strand:- start:694 stop:1350 length:657 start_codon:yes stop_codon:yes gene_type:complete